MASEAQKKALEKYKAKVKRFTVDFPPSDADLWEHMNSQQNKQGYIKSLIRADMERKESQRKRMDVTKGIVSKEEAAKLFFGKDDPNK